MLSSLLFRAAKHPNQLLKHQKQLIYHTEWGSVSPFEAEVTLPVTGTYMVNMETGTYRVKYRKKYGRED